MCACTGLTLGGLLVTGLSTWAKGSRILKGTNPIWSNRFRHFHQRLDDSITCRRTEELLSTGFPERTASVSYCVLARYLECLPLLHGELAAVPGDEVIRAAVDSLRFWRQRAVVSERRGDRRRYRAVEGGAEAAF